MEVSKVWAHVMLTISHFESKMLDIKWLLSCPLAQCVDTLLVHFLLPCVYLTQHALHNALHVLVIPMDVVVMNACIMCNYHISHVLGGPLSVYSAIVWVWVDQAPMKDSEGCQFVEDLEQSPT